MTTPPPTTLDSPPLIGPGDEAKRGRLHLIARHFVDSGRVVPTVVLDVEGTARSQWVPLPATSDRPLIATLLDEDTPEDHLRVARLLAEEVDRLTRARLHGAGCSLVARRKGRRSVPQAWLESLSSLDPVLPDSLAVDKVAAFCEAVGEWVASGAVTRGRARLCLRVHEPGSHPDAPVTDPAGGETDSETRWWLELLIQDAEEPSLMVPIADLWAGAAPFPVGSVEEVLRSLARMVSVAPELAEVLDHGAPTGLALDTDGLLGFVELRTEPLAEIGVAVLLPSWWRKRSRVTLRARASSPSTGSKGVVVAAGLDLDQLVSFKLEAALGDRRLTTADLAQLERAAASKRQLVQLRGEWVQLDPDELHGIIERVGHNGRSTVAELVRSSLGLSGLGAIDEEQARTGGVSGEPATGTHHDAPPVAVVASGWLGRLLDEVHTASVRPQPTPDSFNGVLRPYQERGVGWLTFLGRLNLGACLADDMGLGKTAQLIATLLADPTSGPTLVICPVSVLGNWAREIERFAPELSVLVHHGSDRHRDDTSTFAERAERHDVVLSTYSLVARDIDHLCELQWGRVVLDEAQQVKNPATATARAVRRLDTRRRIAMTGTPVENRLAELWSIMELLNPGLLGSMASFTRRFAGPIEREADEEATATLQQLVGPFVLRRLKSDKTIIDDLPDKIEQTERCPLTREQATLYQAVVDELLRAAESEEGIARSGAVLAGIAKLKQVCNHPAHFLGDGSSLPGRSGKLDRVEELLDEIVESGDKVLCFTQFAEWGSLLAPHLSRRYGTEPLWLHGGVPRSKREGIIKRFQDGDGPAIFLLSVKAGGTGLNLTAASQVIHLDRWWNPAVEDQATDRAYRIGQRRSVLVHKLVSSGTIEERIDEMINAKRALAQRVVGSGEQWITKLDTAALREVVALRDEEER